MGTKQFRKRQYLFLYLACFVIGLTGFSGCAHLSETNRPVLALKKKDVRHLEKVRTLIEEQNFNAALGEIDLISPIREDHALFQKGLIYIFPGNPFRNDHKAIGCFQYVYENFPESDVRNEAYLIGHLLRQKIAINNQIAELSTQNGKMVCPNGNTNKKNLDLKKIFKEKNQKIKALQQQIDELKDQIQQLKEIDLGIEKRKREVLPN